MVAALMVRGVAGASPRAPYREQGELMGANLSRWFQSCVNHYCGGQAQHTQMMQLSLLMETRPLPFPCQIWTVSHVMGCGGSLAAAFQLCGGGCANLAVP